MNSGVLDRPLGAQVVPDPAAHSDTCDARPRRREPGKGTSAGAEQVRGGQNSPEGIQNVPFK